MCQPARQQRLPPDARGQMENVNEQRLTISACAPCVKFRRLKSHDLSLLNPAHAVCVYPSARGQMEKAEQGLAKSVMLTPESSEGFVP